MAREGVPLVVIQRQLGHANLGVTSIYLQGIDNSEIIDTVRARRPPVISATAGLHTTPTAYVSPITPGHAPRGRRVLDRTRIASVITATPSGTPTHLHG